LIESLSQKETELKKTEVVVYAEVE
jgi:hypothetical protein